MFHILLWTRILSPVEVGDYMLEAISPSDRGRIDPTNMVAVVIDKQDKTFQVATIYAVLNRLVLAFLQCGFSGRLCSCSCLFAGG